MSAIKYRISNKELIYFIDIYLERGYNKPMCYYILEMGLEETLLESCVNYFLNISGHNSRGKNRDYRIMFLQSLKTLIENDLI